MAQNGPVLGHDTPPEGWQPGKLCVTEGPGFRATRPRSRLQARELRLVSKQRSHRELDSFEGLRADDVANFRAHPKARRTATFRASRTHPAHR